LYFEEAYLNEETDIKNEYKLYVDYLKKDEKERLEFVTLILDEKNGESFNKLKFMSKAANNKM